jgi:hypothetical protein
MFFNVKTNLFIVVQELQELQNGGLASSPFVYSVTPELLNSCNS